MTVDSTGHRLLAEAARPVLAEIRRDQAGAPPKIAEMLRYLEGALFDPSLNVTTWRRVVGSRDNDITIKFRRALNGASPKKYLTRCRLAVAMRLLAQTDLKVWQIGELVGYSGIGIFSRAFHRETGQRPIDFRRQHGGDSRPAPLRFTIDQCRDALGGALPANDVSALLAAILRQYPEVASQLGD